MAQVPYRYDEKALDGLSARDLAAAVPDPIVMVDERGAVRYANEAATSFFGAIPEGTILTHRFRTPDMRRLMDAALRELAEDTVTPDELRENIITTLQRVDERTEAEDEAEVVALLAEPQHMNMAEAELIRALQSDRDGGQEERY